MRLRHRSKEKSRGRNRSKRDVYSRARHAEGLACVDCYSEGSATTLVCTGDASAPLTYSSNCTALRSELCSRSTRSCARQPIAFISVSYISVRQPITSRPELGRRISSPGVKNVSNPGQRSDAIVAPKPAASNKRTEGE